LPVLRAVSKEPDLFDDPSSLQAVAADWMRNENQLELEADGKIIQRYALVVLDMALHATKTPKFASLDTDECEWPGVTCNTNVTATALFSPVESLNWTKKGLTGHM
jgi:hypothetical protein